VDGLSTFITNYSTHPQWTEAWEEKAFLQWAYLDFYDEAAQTLTDYVTVFPNSSSAVDFLMTAGRILERNNRLEEAARTWQRAADEYPGSSQAATALYMAGITHYRRGNFAAAAMPSAQPGCGACTEKNRRSNLWTGKAQQQLGDLEAAQNAWQQGGRDRSGRILQRRA
jgi:tetratricopeptide (TPR) repeat protein